MAWEIQNAHIGMQPIGNISATQLHPLGMIVTAQDIDRTTGDDARGAGEFIYLLGVASTAAGSLVLYNPDDFSTSLATAGDKGSFAVAMAANVASSYGWYQIKGKASVKVLAGFADNASCFLTSTAGSIDDAEVAGDLIFNMKGASAIASGAADVEIDRPYTAALSGINQGVLTGTSLALGAAGSETAVTATGAELNKLDDSAAVMTAGAGIAGIAVYATGVFRIGDIIHTRILVDLTDLVVDDADLDIIGDNDAASANFGQITAALNGTIIGGRMTCLEVPAGAGSIDDIDLYAATEGTGQEGVASGVASLTETALVTSGAAWTLGRTLALSGLPAANQYLYLVAGAAGGDNTAFTAGKFLIELYGTA